MRLKKPTHETTKYTSPPRNTPPPPYPPPPLSLNQLKLKHIPKPNPLLPIRRPQKRIPPQPRRRHQPRHLRLLRTPHHPMLHPGQRTPWHLPLLPPLIVRPHLIPPLHHTLARSHTRHPPSPPCLLPPLKVPFNAVRLQPVEAELLHGLPRARVVGFVGRAVGPGLVPLQAVPERVAVLREQPEGLGLDHRGAEPLVGLGGDLERVPGVVGPGAGEVPRKDFGVFEV